MVTKDVNDRLIALFSSIGTMLLKASEGMNLGAM